MALFQAMKTKKEMHFVIRAEKGKAEAYASPAPQNSQNHLLISRPLPLSSFLVPFGITAAIR
jgi:hypothetical protein